MSEKESGVLVGSGSFLVDRGRALDKLMRFQLPNPAAFGLAWARCASAGGASSFSVTANAGVLTVVFDGRPFTKAELEDPYRCLFEKRTAATDRNRQLAVGLLSLLRLKPVSIRLTSGLGPERRSLIVESLEHEGFVDAAEGSDTVLTAAWAALDYAPAREAADLVRTGCVLSPMEISVDGVALPPWTEGAEERIRFEEAGVRGWVAVPASPAEESELQLCLHGTVIERVLVKLPLVQVRGAINDDEFTLNASQSGIVRDARFDAAVKRLAEPAQALILATARSLAATRMLPELQDHYYRRRWRETLEEGREEGVGAGFGTVINAAQTLWTMASQLDVKATEEPLLRRAAAVRWLRRLSARRLRPRTKPSKDDALNALWSAPLYVAADGGSLSLDELAEQRKRLSYIPFCDDPAVGFSLPFRPLWSISAGEADLPARLLEAPARDVSATISAIKRDPTRKAGKGSFEKAGLPAPLIRIPLELRTIAGEIGLSSRPERGRLHLLTQGLPSGLVELEGGLRFEAVVADPERRWEESPLTGPLTGNDKELCTELAALAHAAAPALYRRIAQEYDPGDVSARAAAIRSHLLDFLGFVLRSPSARGEDGWIKTVALFQDPDGLWVDHGLASRAMRSEPLYAARSDQEHAWQHGKKLILSPDLDAARLDLLFPGSARFPIRGRSGVFTLLPGVDGCAAAPAGVRCVAAFRLGADVVHGVMRDDGPLAWDKLTVHAAEGPAIDLTGHHELILEVMLALIRQAGPLLEAPDDPLRAFFLKALASAPAPWPGAVGRELWEALKGKPVFRSPFSPGRTLEDVFAALRVAGARLTYASAASESGPQPDVVLDARELESLRRFQPLGADNLRPFGSPARARRVPSAEPEDPAPSNLLSVFRGKPCVRPHERFFLERRYADRGFDVWLGLSTRMPPPPPAVIEGGLAIDLSGLPPLASILVDTGAAHKASDAKPALIDFLRQFYEEAAARWPIAKRASPDYAVAQRYMLEALRLSAVQPSYFNGWKPVLRTIRGLKLFTALGGGLVSLDELAQAVDGDGRLYFAAADEPLSSVPDGPPIPMLRYPKIVAEILSVKSPVKLKRYKPPVAPAAPVASLAEAMQALGRPHILLEPAPSAPDAHADEVSAAAAVPAATEAAPPPAEDLAQGGPVIEGAFRLLSGLSGRKGLKLPRHELAAVRLGRGFEGALLVQGGAWTLNADDALVRAVLDSSLSSEEQAAYLASIAFTASNRLKNVVTDLDDIRFQEALADTL